MTAHIADRSTFATRRHAYPPAFYIAHKLFRLPNRAPAWGDLLDGPTVSFCDVVTDCFDGEPPPTPQTLRVWYIEPGHPASNVTAAAIAAVLDRREAIDE